VKRRRLKLVSCAINIVGYALKQRADLGMKIASFSDGGLVEERVSHLK
jgi:hypothetical protein